MTNAELVSVLDEILQILARFGYTSHASRIEEARKLLANPTATADAVETTIETLHRSVLGMGGLLDISLTRDGSPAPKERQRLDELSERLYELTR